MRSLLVLTLTLLTFSPFAHAVKFTPLVTAALEFGGDTLIEATYTDGTKSSIEAGRGMIGAGGVVIDLSEVTPYKIDLQTTLGFKFTSTKEATNATIDWNRWPLEVLALYKDTEKNYRAGGGIVYQFNNEVKGTGDAQPLTTKLDNAVGIVLAADYIFGAEKNMTVGARHTSINYKAQLPGAVSIVGSSLGISYTYFWQ